MIVDSDSLAEYYLMLSIKKYAIVRTIEIQLYL